MRNRLAGGCFLVLFLFLGGPARGQGEQTREQRWREDLRYLAEELPKRHKDLFFKLKREDFEGEVSGLDRAIPGLSDEEVKTALIRLVARVGDAHTSIGWGYRFRYPINLYQFGRDLYVTSAAEDYKQIVGMRLVEIGVTPIDKAKAAISELVSHDNEEWLKSQLPSFLSNADFLYGLKLLPATGEGKFTFTNSMGRKASLTLKAVPAEATLKYISVLDQSKVPLYLQKQNQNYWFEYLQESKTLYLNYNRCQEIKDRPFKAFTDEVMAFVDANPVERLVIDLRRNSGGNEGIFFPLLLKIRSHEKLNQKGKLFVVIGRRTFSSGFGNARSLKTNTQAILVGEPTGQKPNAFGEVGYFQLPHSKLAVNFSTKFWIRMEGDPPTMAPDILIEPAFEEFAAGRDPVLEAILKYHL